MSVGRTQGAVAGTEQDYDYIYGLFPCMSKLSDPALRRTIASIWLKVWRQSKWDRLEDCPMYEEFPPKSKVSLVNHINSVATNAETMVQTLERDFGYHARLEMVITLALLHDVSKVIEYEPAGERTVRSTLGNTFLHAIWSGVEAYNAGIDPEVVKIIILHPHHPPHTHVLPVNVEHLILHYAELGTADPLFFIHKQATHMEYERRFFRL